MNNKKVFSILLAAFAGLFLWVMLCGSLSFVSILCVVGRCFDNNTGWDRMVFAGRDPFYVGNGEPDLSRIPIIPPYTIFRNAGENRWKIAVLNKHNNEEDPLFYYSGIGSIQQMAVQNGVILVRTNWTKPPNKLVQWAVFIPNKKIEIGFTEEEDFLSYIQALEINNLRWMEPDGVFQEFSSTSCLEWIPDCR